MCYKNRAKYKFSQKSFNKMEIKEKSNIFGRSLFVYIVLMEGGVSTPVSSLSLFYLDTWYRREEFIILSPQEKEGGRKGKGGPKNGGDI